MLFDNHIHTKYSADSDMRPDFAIMEAADKGIGLVFTEHYDPDFPGDTDFTFDKAAYFKEYEPLRSSRLRLGVELGMREDTVDKVLAFVKDEPFDLTIGSLHVLDGKDIYDEDFYDGKEKQKLYARYLEEMERMIRLHPFIDVLGHIDYICRHAPYSNPDMTYGDFAREIDAVLRAVIETDTTLELPTKRFASRQARKELFTIYKRFYDLGGRYVTLGSDAHTQDAIGAYFIDAENLARETGLSVVTFREHRMQVSWYA